MMCEVKLTGEDGSVREYVLPYESLWMVRGNFSGMGKFVKIEITVIK